MILGTTAERLLGRCRCPVIVARRPAHAAYRRAVVAVDFSAYSKAALEATLRLAPQAHVTLVHAFAAPFEGKMRYAGVDDATVKKYRAEARREALADLLEMVRGTLADRNRLSHAVAFGSPSRVIIDKAASLKADLVVVGKHGRSATEEWLLGSVTRHVLSAAKCDVLVVQQPAVD
jgi:nucleotide-binding universal stress UspA family protein